MENLNFNDLPKAVGELKGEIEIIKSLLTQAINQKGSDELLTLTEASEFLSIAKPTMYLYVQKNTIPFCRVARKLYFSKKDLMSWVLSTRSKTIDEIE